MNWGHKITISLGVFMAMTLVMVYIAVKQKDITLVSENYYEDELAYQQIIDKMENVRDWEHQIKLSIQPTEKMLNITYPENVSMKGHIRFFRPSDEHQDFKMSMQPELGTQAVALKGRSKGLWKVMMEWESEGKTFYQEEKIILP
jgi:nitrogen fixation protein FixH